MGLVGWIPLKDLCENYKNDIVDGPFGSNLKRDDYKEEGLPVLKIQNISPFDITLKKMDYVTPEKYEELKRHSFTKGDIIMTKLGDPLGASAIVDGIEDGLIVADLVRIRPEKINRKYLCYHLNSPITNNFINSKQRGTTRPRVRISDVRDLPIYTPPLPEQKSIVAILDEAFEAIDKAKANVERNIENAEELFQSKLEEVFSQRGEGWEEKKIKDISGTASNIKWKKVDGERKYIDLSSVSRETLSITETEYIDRKNAPSRAKKIVKEQDILFGTTRPTLKRVTIINDEYTNQVCSTGFYVIRPNNKIITSEWIFLFLQTKAFMDRMKKIQSGASYPAVTYSDMKNTLIGFPRSINEQKRLSSQLFELQNKKGSLIDIYQTQLTTLNELKKSILQKAFSGELTENETVVA